MRQSANLNVISKALDKVAGRLGRDFGEIENLQNNHLTAIKFSNACAERIKNELGRELSFVQPGYNLEFVGGEKITNNPAAEFSYFIAAIDGLTNLSRAIPAFTNVVAVKKNGGEGEIIYAVINNISNNEIYSCEKGRGAFLNGRRIRVSERRSSANIYCAVSQVELLKNPQIAASSLHFRVSNCPSLDIAYLASGRLDICVLGKNEKMLGQMLALLVKEAGGSVVEKDELLIMSNFAVRSNFLS